MRVVAGLLLAVVLLLLVAAPPSTVRTGPDERVPAAGQLGVTVKQMGRGGGKHPIP